MSELDDLSLEVRTEYLRLRREHEDAYEARISMPEETDEADELERRRWDALIDFIEEHDLQETALDPRQGGWD